MAVQAVPPQTQTLVTGEELLAMGDIGPCELIEGRVVLMSPTGLRHGRHEIRFGKHLDDFVSQHNLGVVAVGEVGIYIRRNPDTVRAADVAFISHTRLAQQKQPSGFLEIAPELVVEIMSPDDRWSEVKQKLREYFSIGVKLIWVRSEEHTSELQSRLHLVCHLLLLKKTIT